MRHSISGSTRESVRIFLCQVSVVDGFSLPARKLVEFWHRYCFHGVSTGMQTRRRQAMWTRLMTTGLLALVMSVMGPAKTARAGHRLVSRYGFSRHGSVHHVQRVRSYRGVPRAGRVGSVSAYGFSRPRSDHHAHTPTCVPTYVPSYGYSFRSVRPYVGVQVTRPGFSFSYGTGGFGSGIRLDFHR